METTKTKVYNLIILDESGSMASIHKAAVDGLNETLQTIQSAQKQHGETQEHYVTMVFFNSNGVRSVVENAPIANVQLLRMKDFEPNASTPLFDAMGVSLSKLRYQLNRNDDTQVLVTIITDGEENASREYSGSMIKNMVEELKELGWFFAYIGANQDVGKIADAMSIKNSMRFETTDKGSRMMAEKLNKSRAIFFSKMSEKKAGKNVDLHDNFFEEEENNAGSKK